MRCSRRVHRPPDQLSGPLASVHFFGDVKASPGTIPRLGLAAAVSLRDGDVVVGAADIDRSDVAGLPRAAAAEPRVAARAEQPEQFQPGALEGEVNLTLAVGSELIGAAFPKAVGCRGDARRCRYDQRQHSALVHCSISKVDIPEGFSEFEAVFAAAPRRGRNVGRVGPFFWLAL